MRIPRRFVWTSVVAIAVNLLCHTGEGVLRAGTADQAPAPASIPPEPRSAPAAESAVASISPEEISALSREITPEVERIRGAKFLHTVPVKIVNDAAARDHFLARLDKFWPADQIRREQSAFTLLGLLPPGVDLLRTVMDVLKEQAGGYYDPDENTFFILDDMPRSVAPILMSHELTHALDDQHFNIDGQIAKVREGSDRAQAFASIVEGSGTLVMSVFTVQQIKSGKLSADALNELQASEAGRAEKLRAAPELLQRQLLASYILGQRFLLRGDVSRLGTTFPDEAAHGERAARSPFAADLDLAFREPPVSTEQVLHPEKYWDDSTRDLPRVVTVADLSARLGDGWKRLDTGTLGELAIAVLTQKTPLDLLTPDAALGDGWTNPAAAGWGGDTWQLYGRNEARAAVLATVWDSGQDAKEFRAALADRPGLSIARRDDAVVLVATDSSVAANKAAALAESLLPALAPRALPGDDSTGASAANSAPPNARTPAPARCPDPSPDVVCAMIYAPVVCDGCRYSNGCVARAAGFDPEKDCVKAPPAE